MSYSTIYDMDGNTVMDGLHTRLISDMAARIARVYARDDGKSVIVEDRGTKECYRVTPGGHFWKAPKGWIATWDSEDEDCY